MKLFAGVLVSLLSMSVLADDNPNGIICGEYAVSSVDDTEVLVEPKPISNGFILYGTGVLHGSDTYMGVNPEAAGLNKVVKAYYQASRDRLLYITEDGGHRVTITVSNSRGGKMSKDKVTYKEVYTSCTYLLSSDTDTTFKATQAVYRF
jgi:hypothetical protein